MNLTQRNYKHYITWTLDSGSLPNGLTLSESGIISDPPAKSGTYTFTITISNGIKSDSKEFTIIVSVSGSSLEITTTSLKNGTDGKKYSVSLKAKGAKSLTWQAANLPDGLAINESNGKISGTPTQGFNGKITIIATNAAGEYANKLTLKITAEKPAITSINNYGLKSAIIGENYIISCAGTGTPPLSWDFTGFPEGMSYDVKTGILSGIINQSLSLIHI